MVVSIRWLGHSGFLISDANERIYIDLYRTKELTKRVPDKLESATIVLMTHGHNDHCNEESISEVRDSKTILVGPKSCTEKLGKDVRVVRPGEEIQIRNIGIKAVDAYNTKRFRSPGNPFHPKGYGVGYLIKIGGHTIYHAGDTDLIPEMKDLGQVDVALLPCGDTYTMDNKEAAEAAKAICPKVAIPMHTWDKGIDVFNKGIDDIDGTVLVALKEGESYNL